jgi:hypothetical protein
MGGPGLLRISISVARGASTGLPYTTVRRAAITLASKYGLGVFGITGAASLRSRTYRCSKWNVPSLGGAGEFLHTRWLELAKRPFILVDDRTHLRDFHRVIPDHEMGLTRILEEAIAQNPKLQIRIRSEHGQQKVSNTTPSSASGKSRSPEATKVATTTETVNTAKRVRSSILIR